MKKTFSWANLRLLLMFVLIIFMYSFTGNRNASRKLKASEVVFSDDSNPFINRETVNKLLIENNHDATALQKDKVDLNRLEKSVNSNPMIEKSEVFVGIDGTLKAVVKQKTPIARVFGASDSFYLDYQGNEMPLSEEFTARVPIISGEINKADRTDLNKLLQFVYNDDFLRKDIIGVEVLSNGNLKMLSRDYDYEIDFGQSINIERKFGNYKAFFQKAVADSTLNQYKKINLKFTQQVVCTK